MSSLSAQSYSTRASKHSHPLVRRLLTIAEAKKTNIVISADVTTTKELLELADALGPYIAVLKTHIDIVSDFSPSTTLPALQSLSRKHDFLLFEDRKFIDIGNTVQKQYHGGALKISSWAHLVNCSILPGEGIVEALAKTVLTDKPDKSLIEYRQEGRGLLILAEMTSKGSLATGEYTVKSVEYARRYKNFVVGFVCTKSLGDVAVNRDGDDCDEDFVVFTTGVNLSSKGDALGQQYQTPSSAIERGADFLIAGRGIYAAADPIEAVRQYRKEGWEAYLKRIGAEKILE